MKRWAILLSLLAGAGLAQAATEVTPWEHYQAIVERAPFGTVAGATDSGPLPNFATRYVFAGMVPSETQEGGLLAVIFDTEKSRSELVAPGQTFGDVKLVRLDVDGENSKIVLQRGLEPATLRLKPRETSIPIATSGPVQVTAQPNAPAVQSAPPAGERTVVVPARRRIPFRRGEE